MRKWHISIWVSFFCLSSLTILAQKNEKHTNRYLEVIHYSGGLFGARDSANERYIEGTYYNAMDIRFGWRSRKASLYASLYRYPTFGIGFYTGTFGTPTIGTPNALYGFADIPFATPKRKWEFIYSFGFGLSYNFNPYDKEENPGNILIGSKRNVYINIHARANYHLSKNVDLGIGLGFTHFSNGSYRLPNYGLNMVPLILSAKFKVDNNSTEVVDAPAQNFAPKHSLNVYWGNGSKNYRIGGTNHWKTTLGIVYLKHFHPKYRFGFGFDLFYAAGAVDRIPGNASAFSKSISAAPYIAWEWVITDRLYMPMNIGIYLHRNKDNDEANFFYERIGLRYKVKDRLFTGIALKAHEGAADFVEWTIGYAMH